VRRDQRRFDHRVADFEIELTGIVTLAARDFIL
jgi:hypothetical protein